jgi:hypothetical protein
MTKFAARGFFALQRDFSGPIERKWGVCAALLTAFRLDFTIHLESAAFVFHISGTTQGITGSLRAACSEPVQRFLACPFS